MPSNVENILNGILTGDGSDIQKPASRVEELLFEIYEQGGGGGDSVIGGIKLTIDSNYVMTATLVDKDGEEYGVGDDIDLPLEEMVVNAEYDPQTQKIKLELKNGNYVEFSVAELVSGLQTELSSSNKLNPAYIDYDASHRAVSDTEKSTWDAKQNAISDLDTIRSGAAAGATAVQPSEMQTALSAKQDTISDLAAIRSGASAGASAVQPETMSTALALKQDSLSETQLAAVNSGIDTTKVAQIETNKTNILSVQNATKELVDKGAKNLYDISSFAGYSGYGMTLTNNGDGTITANGTVSIAFIGVDLTPLTLDAGTYVLSGCPSGGGNNSYMLQINGPSYVEDIGDGAVFTLTSSATITVRVRITQTSTSITKMFKPMICTKAEWDISQQFEPYALPNYDLTRLQAEDRAALVEVVDAGAKNKLDFASLTPTQVDPDTGVNVPTFTKTDTTFTISGNYSWTRVVYGKIHLLPGTYILSSRITSATFATDTFGALRVSNYPNNSDQIVRIDFSTTGTISSVPFEIATERDVYIALCANYTGTILANPNSFTATDFMICTEAGWKISQNFVPYALPNTDLTRMMTPFFTVPINHNMIYRGQNLGETFTEAQHTALSSGNFTDLYLGDYWTKTVTIPAGTYTGGDGEEVTVPAQTNITLKAVIADFDTFYAGYASTYAGINTHHAAVIVTGFSNVVWNSTNTTAGGYVNSLIHKWLVGSVLPQIETWFGSAKVLSHQKLLTNAITGDAASGWAWSSQKISLLSENQMYGSKVWGNSIAANGGYEPGEAFKHLNVFNHIDANLLFGNKNIWLRDIASAVGAAYLYLGGDADRNGASNTWIAPAALILLS